jgi:hypothetical protein
MCHVDDGNAKATDRLDEVTAGTMKQDSVKIIEKERRTCRMDVADVNWSLIAVSETLLHPAAAFSSCPQSISSISIRSVKPEYCPKT